MHNHERDTIDQIDQATEEATEEVSEPGPDAMRWTRQDGEESPDAFDAVLLGIGSGGLVRLDPATADDRVIELVGDPDVTHLEAISGVDFWLPESGMYLDRTNVVATHLFTSLVRDVADGNYTTSDDDREYARNLQAAMPVLYGSCLITGVNQNGDGHGPLSDQFWTWYHRYAEKVAEQVTARHIAALLRRHGIPSEAITEIVIIDG